MAQQLRLELLCVCVCVFLRRNEEDHQSSFSMGVQIAGEANLLGCEDMACRHMALHTNLIAVQLPLR